MKSSFNKISAVVAAIAVGLALAACGGQAQAQELYRTTPNTAVGTVEIIKLEKQSNGYLKATTTTGQVFQNFAYDPSSAIINKVLADHPKWIFNGVTLYAMPKAVTATCTNQGTAIYWPYSVVSDVITDGCQVAYQNAVNATQVYN